MGVFSDYISKYHEAGLSCVPCRNDKKAPLFQDWTKYCDQMPTDNEIEEWTHKYHYLDKIGLCTGKISGVVAFDFDYWYDEKHATISREEFEKDYKIVERQILQMLPQSPCIKKGQKGWTRFYKWTPHLDESSNILCDRNGLRLFDFLSWHRQTIMPPSIHSVNAETKTVIRYNWIGQPIEECLNDLPEIDLSIVRDLKIIFDDFSSGQDGGGRHGSLYKWLKNVMPIENDLDALAKKLIQKDLDENPENPYLSDKKHHRNGDAKENAMRWVTRVKKYLTAKKITGKKIIDANDSYGTWEYFFENTFKHCRKDIISKDVFVKKDAVEPWVNVGAMSDVLASYAQIKGMPHSQTKIHLSRWAYEKADMDYLCDIPKWDGVDRIDLFAKCISSPDFTHEDISLILKQWGSNIFRRVESPKNQNRCPLFKGGQGIGKDSLINSMLCGFAPYYNMTTLPGTQKDALEIASRLLICHIEEFDQTKHLDVAFIKSLISQPSAFFRESYGHSPNEKIMRPSFISTANVDDILRDPTGNRRFIVIPVKSIAWDYPKNQSAQVMAQFKHIKDAGQMESLPEALEAKIKSILDSYTPEDLAGVVVELYLQKFKRLVGIESKGLFDSEFRSFYSEYGYLKYVDVAEATLNIAKIANCSIRRVQSILKHAGLTHKFRDGVKCFLTKEDMQKIRYRYVTDELNKSVTEISL